MRKWRPSPALAVSFIALFVALFGTAYAASKINGKTIKNKSIAGKKLKDETVTGKQLDASTVTAGNVLAATVPAGDSCTITSQTGGITAVLVGSGQTGVCDVTFPRSVEECSVGATPLHPQADIAGQASIRYLGGATVRVTRRNGLDNFQAAGLFSIFAVCPTA